MKMLSLTFSFLICAWDNNLRHGTSTKKDIEAHLFFRGEVIDDVEQLPDFLWSLSLDHVRDGLAADIAE